jgi:amino acid transporter
VFDLLSKGSKVFIRDATGVVRAISPLNASIVSFLIINWGLGLSLAFVVTPTVLPGANIGLGFLLCIPFIFVNALAYTMLTEAMPRSGGDYVWMSRILNPMFAIGLEFMVTVFQGLFWGSTLPFTSETILGPGIGGIGLISGNPGLVAASSYFGTNTGIITVGTLIVVLVFIFLVIPLRQYLKIQFALWILGMVSIVLFFVIILSTTHEGFVAAYDSFFRAYNVTYSGTISGAQTAGFSNPGLVTFGTVTLLAIPYLFFVVVGFQWPALIGGELRSPKKAMLYSSVVAGILTALVEGAAGFLIQDRLGASFLNAVAFLSSIGAYKAPIPFNPFFVAMTLNPNLAVDVLLLAGLTAWGILLPASGALVYTRVIMAWGFDRSMPAKLADVNERTHTPIVAIAIFCFFLELGVLSTVYAGIIFANVNMTLILVVLYAFVGLAALLFPYRRKNMFDISPLKNRKIAGVPTIVIIGALNVALFSLLTIFALTYPSLSGPVGTLAFAVMGSMFLLGIVLSFITRAIYKNKGIDTSLAFKEIPPE